MKINTHSNLTCNECGSVFPHMNGPWPQPTICPACECTRNEREQVNDDMRDDEKGYPLQHYCKLCNASLPDNTSLLCVKCSEAVPHRTCHFCDQECIEPHFLTLKFNGKLQPIVVCELCHLNYINPKAA